MVSLFISTVLGLYIEIALARKLYGMRMRMTNIVTSQNIYFPFGTPCIYFRTNEKCQQSCYKLPRKVYSEIDTEPTSCKLSFFYIILQFLDQQHFLTLSELCRRVIHSLQTSNYTSYFPEKGPSYSISTCYAHMYIKVKCHRFQHSRLASLAQWN